MVDTIYFTDIMSDQMQLLNMKCPALTAILNKNGLVCTTRQVQRYKNGECVPVFKTATEICKILKIPISKKDLEKILEDSCTYAKEIKKAPVRRKQKAIKLNLNDIDLGSEIQISDLSEIIDDRLMELYKSRDKLNFYVAKLIEEDLKHNILGKE